MNADTHHRNPWHISAASPRVTETLRTLKQGDTFGVFDHYGDITRDLRTEQGLYHDGTRFLSRWELRIDDNRPMLLSSSVEENNSRLAADLTTLDIYRGDKRVVPKEVIHVFRSSVLWQGTLYQRLRLRNFGEEAVDLNLEIRAAADYADIFEVRGSHRKARGDRLPAAIEGSALTLGYQGLDGKTRRTRIQFEWQPDRIEDGRCATRLHLKPGEMRELGVRVACLLDSASPPAAGFDEAMDCVNRDIAAKRVRAAVIDSSNAEGANHE
jgi:glycogen debranching enzyme